MMNGTPMSFKCGTLSMCGTGSAVLPVQPSQVAVGYSSAFDAAQHAHHGRRSRLDLFARLAPTRAANSAARATLRVAAVILFLLAAFTALAEEDTPDPAAELQALKDMQVMLERLGDDHTEQPQEREATLSALARVR